MNDNQELNEFQSEPGSAIGIGSDSGDEILGTIDRMLETTGVDAVFGIPVEQGEYLVIPAAEVVAAGGFGFGSGGADEAPEDANGEGGYAGGSGGGGGGYSFSRPVAVIVAGPNGVRIEPVIDLTKIILAGITASALALGIMGQMRRMSRSLREIERNIP